MKFTLTVTDATLEELKSLLGAGGAVELVVPPTAPTTVSAPSTAAVVPPPTVPAPVDTGPTPVSVVSPPAPTVPVAAAPAPAPASPPADTTSPAPSVDVTGLPWDERIHSGNKALNGDGSWRAKRGLNDPALKARVEVELRARSAGVAPPLPLPVPTPPPVPEAPAVVTPPPLPTPVAAAPAAWSFETLLNRVVVSKLTGTPELNAAMASVGASAFGDLAMICAADPSKAAAVAAHLGLQP